MRGNDSQLSVNICTHCRQRHITLAEEKQGYTECAECTYFQVLGIHTIEQYNDRLRNLNKRLTPVLN